MPFLLLIRHGENDYTRRGQLAGRLPGVHLNEKGKEQAQNLANALGDLPIKALYSSPLERAVETAAPLAEILHVSIRIDPGLTETNVGRWQGKSIRLLRYTRHWQLVQRTPSRTGLPGGESFTETQARVVAALEAICAQFGSQDVITCILHADPIKLAVAHFIGLPLDNFQHLTCDTGSVTLLELGKKHAQLIWLNHRLPLDTEILRKRS